MSKFESPLNNLKVASPCSMDWDAMYGDDRKRFCGECKMNVFNLSGMTQVEAERLVMNAEGRVCVRFYKRADGTVMTKDCPVGWARVKERTTRYVSAIASLVFTFFGALGLVSLFKRPTPQITMGDIAIANPTPPKKRETPRPTPDEPRPLMGAIAVRPSPSPTPKATPKNEPKKNDQPEFVMGKVRID